jgi:hypothetical protein
VHQRKYNYLLLTKSLTINNQTQTNNNNNNKQKELKFNLDIYFSLVDKNLIFY